MKIKRLLSNIFLVLNYYVKYVPLYFFGQIGFTIFVSFIWTLQGPITTKYILDGLSSKKSVSELVTFLCIVTVLVVIRHLLACYFVEYLETVSDIRMKEKLLKEIYKKASTLDLEYYESPEFYTDYVWAAEQATKEFTRIMGLFITLVARGSELIFMGGVMIVLDPVLLIFAIVIGLIRMFEQRKQIKLTYEINQIIKPIERERNYLGRIFYLSDYAKEIRLSNIHEVLYEKFENANGRILRKRIKLDKEKLKYKTVSEISCESLSTFGMNAYLAYGVIVRRNITIGEVSALFQSATRFSNRLRQVINICLDFSEYSLYVEKYRKFMEYKPKIEGRKGKIPSSSHEPIILKDVSFTYHGEDNPTLSRINMTIEPHQKIAIVGYNGAGKTTLIKLIMGLYEPTEGNIYLGDINIKEFDTQSYRKLFAAVFQDYKIFAATLAENVVMDEVKNSHFKDVNKALVHSNFKDKLDELPLNIHTPLTKEFDSNGVNLSGGEAQKVAIARAFFKDSQYAIMDEPSSALDPMAEYKLHENMIDISNTRTVIFISHRLSTTVMADKIYMFENGKIVEEGSHGELMALDEKYAAMFKKQGLNYRTKGE